GTKPLPSSITSAKYPTNLSKSILNYYYLDKEKPMFERPEDIVELKIDRIQYDDYHKVVLASEYMPERYTLIELFDKNNLPPISESIDKVPAVINANIQNNLIEISFETNKLFDYKLYKVVNKNTILLDEILESDGMYVFIDNKIDSNKIEYYYERKQKFLTNKIEVSNIISLYPDEKKIFKNENKAKNVVPKSTKKKWYV
ncbi:MAG: hypothetical protein PHP83_00910, partial [Clostridia bacterium]|nr:hypothetical protein [Clostridia bacterium]